MAKLLILITILLLASYFYSAWLSTCLRLPLTPIFFILVITLYKAFSLWRDYSHMMKSYLGSESDFMERNNISITLTFIVLVGFTALSLAQFFHLVVLGHNITIDTCLVISVLIVYRIIKYIANHTPTIEIHNDTADTSLDISQELPDKSLSCSTLPAPEWHIRCYNDDDNDSECKDGALCLEQAVNLLESQREDTYWKRAIYKIYMYSHTHSKMLLALNNNYYKDCLKDPKKFQEKLTTLEAALQVVCNKKIIVEVSDSQPWFSSAAIYFKELKNWLEANGYCELREKIKYSQLPILSGKCLVLGYTDEHRNILEFISKPETIELLKKVLLEVSGFDMDVKLETVEVYT